MQKRAKRIVLKNGNEKDSIVLLTYDNICEALIYPEVWTENLEHKYIDEAILAGTWCEGSTRQFKFERRAFPTTQNPFFAYTCRIENVSIGGYCLSHDNLNDPLKVGQLALIKDNTGHHSNLSIGEIRWTNDNTPAKFGVQIFGFNPEIIMILEVNFRPVKPIFVIAVKIIDSIHERYIITKSDNIVAGDYLSCGLTADFIRVNDLIRNSNHFQCFRAGYGRIGSDINKI